MPRPKDKASLTEASEDNFKKLWEFIDSMTERELDTPFDFSDDEKKTEAHWKRDKNLRDVLIHLYEWHRLLLEWARINSAGGNVPFLPKPYSWRTYGEMNLLFWNENQTTPLDDAKEKLKASHREVMELLGTFTDEQLFTKNAYPWVGGSTLGSYFISCTSSHYDWALKKLKAHRKKLAAK